MNEDLSIIPLCLYSNPVYSYIGLPSKIIENGKISYICPPIPNMTSRGLFYVVNPDIKPIPTYLDLFCVTNVNNQTVEIKNLYDPYNIDVPCIKFLAWMEPTVCTTPLYISKKDGNIHISLNSFPPDISYLPYDIPVIYVLFDPRDKVPNLNCKNIFTIENDKPFFGFSNSFGKCLPDPTSNLSIGRCMVLHNKSVINPENIGNYPHILNYLRSRYSQQNKTNNFRSIISIVLAVILVVILCITVWLNIKNEKRK